MQEGWIIRGRGGLYTVRSQEGAEFVLRAKGKFRRQQITPLVGDRVRFSPGTGEEHGWVEEILPRVSESLRPPVANVEVMVVVVAPSPAPDLLLVDRLLVRARRQNIRVVLVLNKCELDMALCGKLSKEYEKSGAPFLAVSANLGTGLDLLRAQMRGKISCMAGQSGVGKSTLLNALVGLELKTGEISAKIERGKHTTRHAELLEKDGLRVFDTPGFSLLQLEENLDPVLLQEDYPEFAPYRDACKFAPCYHFSEPGCKILQAARAGEIPPERLSRYHILLEEMKKSWRERYD